MNTTANDYYNPKHIMDYLGAHQIKTYCYFVADSAMNNQNKQKLAYFYVYKETSFIITCYINETESIDMKKYELHLKKQNAGIESTCNVNIFGSFDKKSRDSVICVDKYPTENDCTLRTNTMFMSFMDTPQVADIGLAMVYIRPNESVFMTKENYSTNLYTFDTRKFSNAVGINYGNQIFRPDTLSGLFGMVNLNYKNKENLDKMSSIAIQLKKIQFNKQKFMLDTAKNNVKMLQKALDDKSIDNLILERQSVLNQIQESVTHLNDNTSEKLKEEYTQKIHEADIYFNHNDMFIDMNLRTLNAMVSHTLHILESLKTDSSFTKL